MRKYLIVSPHLDDAVLSCGASMRQWISEGAAVVVVSVFTSCGRAQEVMQGKYRQRKEQDEAALRFLGCEGIHLNFTDAPFRDEKYKSFSTILFHHAPVESQLAKEISDALLSIVQRIKPDKVFFPLGIGGHIDHHLVFSASRALRNDVPNLLYYEDLPYALVPAWSIIRRMQLGCCLGLEAYTAVKTVAKLSDNDIPFLENYMNDAEDRQNSNEKYALEIYALSQKLKLPAEEQCKKIADWVNPCAMQHFLVKCKAIELYETEWPVLFGPLPSAISAILIQNQKNIYSETFLKFIL